MCLEKQLDSLPKQINDAGQEWAEANFLYEQMDELKKHVLASLKDECDGSDAARERVALASEAYKKHINAMCEAHKNALIKKIRYDALCKKFDATRTLVSLEKQKINMV